MKEFTDCSSLNWNSNKMQFRLIEFMNAFKLPFDTVLICTLISIVIFLGLWSGVLANIHFVCVKPVTFWHYNMIFEDVTQVKSIVLCSHTELTLNPPEGIVAGKFFMTLMLAQV